MLIIFCSLEGTAKEYLEEFQDGYSQNKLKYLQLKEIYNLHAQKHIGSLQGTLAIVRTTAQNL